MKLLQLVILSVTLIISFMTHAVQTKANGIYSIKFGEEGFPIITSIDILGRTVVPHNSVGADFQMTARSSRGNSYNPTQGGDCNDAKSRLDSIDMNYNTRVGLGSQYGFKWQVTPRNYNEPGQSASNPIGDCLPTQPLMPIQFLTEVTLGDGIKIPREMMVVDMSIRRLNGAEALRPNISELPAMFPHAWRLPYAYHSIDGVNFEKLTKTVNGIPTHDLTKWEVYENVPIAAKVVMFSNQPDAIANPNAGIGIAIYTKDITRFATGHRNGRRYDLGYMAATGSNSSADLIDDYNWHTFRRIVAVGHFNSIKAIIQKANQEFGGPWRWTEEY